MLQLYNYIKQYNPKTKIMASGIRTKEDALALCGIDYLVMPSKVELELAATPTAAGYNDGLHALESGEEGTAAALSVETAQESGINQVSCRACEMRISLRMCFALPAPPRDTGMLS